MWYKGLVNKRTPSRLERHPTTLRPRAWLERADRDLVALSRGAGAVRLALGDGLAAMRDGARYKPLGFSSLGAYAYERLGRGKRWADDTARLATKLAALPAVRAGLASGALSWSVADLLARHATPDTEADLVAQARTSTYRAMLEALARCAAAGDETASTPDGAAPPAADEDEDDERRHLAITVDQLDAWALERTRGLVRAMTGSGCDDALVEALLAEAVTTLLNRHPDLRLPRDLDDPAHAWAREWRAQLATWRTEAERDCEPRIPGHGGEADYAPDFLEQVAAAICDAVPTPRPTAVPTQPEALDARLRELAHDLARRDLALGELARDFWDADGWRRLGYASAGQYVRERLGVSFSTLKSRMTLARRVQRLPAVAATLDAGAVGLESASLVARVAAPKTVDAWLARAAERTTKHLREEVEAAECIARVAGTRAPTPPTPETMSDYLDLERAMLDGRVAAIITNGGQMSGDDPSQMSGDDASQMSGDPSQMSGDPSQMSGDEASAKLRPGAGRVSVRFHLRADLARLWRVVEAMFRRSAEPGPFVAFLVRTFWHTWLKPDPTADRVAYQHIYERERHRCASPVCDNRDLTPHHLLFRSHGGGDEDENVLGLCVACHLELVHSYLITATPPADDVRWELGRDALITVHGRRRVRRVTARAAEAVVTDTPGAEPRVP
ncbi:MAG: DUF222 domain-containing protein [Deltaproteobacteria bacterium]|nr:MAG: DUF222 domain-containing protein [Deltaproteobacteria bacterium]